MLECRHTAGAVVLEIAPDRVTARWWLVLARVVTAGRPARADRTEGAGRAGVTGIAAAAPFAYLLLLAASTGIGAAARASSWPVTAGLLAATALGVVTHCVQLRWRSHLLTHRVVLWHEVSASLLDAAERFAQRAVHGWPEVAALVACPDPRPLLEQALWGLGEQLAALESSRDRLAATDRALRLAPDDGRLHGELVRERDDADLLWRHRERQVARRLAVLRRLAEVCDESRRCRESDPLTTPAGAATAVPGAAADDADVEALATRAEAVVGAYRDLLR